MNKKLAKTLKDANKKLKEEKYLVNYQIAIDGDFTSEYNEIRLENKDGHTAVEYICDLEKVEIY